MGQIPFEMFLTDLFSHEFDGDVVETERAGVY
jgi:hypothetical protein